MSETLKDKVAVVTGAASGMGAAIATEFAQAGSLIVIADKDQAGLERTQAALNGLGAQAVSMSVDVTDADATKSLADETMSRLGRVDVLVNSAGMLTEAPLIEMDVSMWDDMIAVDLRSVFLCCRWIAPHMVRAGSGRIINIASQLGIKGGTSLTHYSAAKAGVIGFTKALARELAPHGVLVNAIAPGPIETPLLAGITSDWKREKLKELPLGRFGTPQEVAPTALLLAGDPSGNLYVGQVLGPNSGDVMP